MDSDEYSCELSNELQVMAKRDLKEDEQTRQRAIKELRRWIETNSNIVRCRTDSRFLLRFLRSKKFHVQSAMDMMERYLVMRTSHPKWYNCLDISDPAIEALIDKGFVFVLPERDLNGRRVVFGIGSAVNLPNVTDSDTMRAMVMTFEALLEDEDNQILGFTYVFESRGLGLSALSIWSPTEFQRAFSTSEKAFPMRHKEVHFVHLPFIINAGFQVFKSFLSEKLRNRLMAHRDFADLSTVIPQRILPREYGGDVPVADMIRLWKNELRSKRDALLQLDQMEVKMKKKKTRKIQRNQELLIKHNFRLHFIISTILYFTKLFTNYLYSLCDFR